MLGKRLSVGKWENYQVNNHLKANMASESSRRSAAQSSAIKANFCIFLETHKKREEEEEEKPARTATDTRHTHTHTHRDVSTYLSVTCFFHALCSDSSIAHSIDFQELCVFVYLFFVFLCLFFVFVFLFLCLFCSSHTPREHVAA